MLLLIAAALPPAGTARALITHLAQRAPTFYAWLQHARAQVVTVDLHETGCTAFEAWQLRRAGFHPVGEQRLSAGLGPLRAGSLSDAEPVWLAEPVHLLLGTQRAALADSQTLALSDSEEQTLFEAALPCLDGSGVTLTRVAPGRWRARLPEALASVSPAAASSGHLENWWPQDRASRPWRRLLNHIQMVWHEHPVNAARNARGQPVANGLWLYGGAQPWTLPKLAPIRICDELVAHAAAGDWANWLEALAVLDRTVLAAYTPDAVSTRALILTDTTRLVTLTPTRHRWARGFSRWLSREPHWTSWWQAQA